MPKALFSLSQKCDAFTRIDLIVDHLGVNSPMCMICPFNVYISRQVLFLLLLFLLFGFGSVFLMVFIRAVTLSLSYIPSLGIGLTFIWFIRKGTFHLPVGPFCMIFGIMSMWVLDLFWIGIFQKIFLKSQFSYFVVLSYNYLLYNVRNLKKIK